jgi:hypothetical protein
MIRNRSGLIALVLIAGIGMPAVAEAAGAMAVGTCGAYGYAIDFIDAAQAPATALQRCQGDGCKVVATMKRNCAAFAIDATNVCGAHGYAVAKSLARAQNDALKHCYKFGGKDCVIRAFVCDGKS